MLVLAEFYVAAVELGAVAERARKAAAGAAGMRFVQAISVPEDESCFVVFEAASVHDVLAAGVRAGLAFDRVVEAHAVGPRSLP